ncbi:MAG: glycosyltransferase family 2 protein [Elusimicrobiota bacterium]
MNSETNKISTSDTLSVIIPVYNECENIEELLQRTVDGLAAFTGRIEIICVDDKSTDSSVEELQKYMKRYPLRVIRLRSHMGQSGALAAGFLKSTGKIIAMLDADLQCSPEEMVLLLEHLEPGIDAVCGIRSCRQDTVIKKISPITGNFFRNLVTGDNITDTNCPLKVFRRQAITSIPYFRGFHRFIPTLMKLNGYTLKQVPVSHFPRKRGHSKYNISNRLFKGLYDIFGVAWLKKNSLVFKDNMEEL